MLAKFSKLTFFSNFSIYYICTNPSQYNGMKYFLKNSPFKKNRKRIKNFEANRAMINLHEIVVLKIFNADNFQV